MAGCSPSPAPLSPPSAETAVTATPFPPPPPLGPVADEHVLGIRLPETLRADEFQLNPQALVIGVSVAGEHRAYLVSALAGSGTITTPEERVHEREKRVVNDLLGGVPVSITFCDENQTVRVFTAPQVEPLTMGVIDWSNDQLQLQCGFRLFAQLDPNAPLEDLPFEVTSWGDWRERHSTTDIYVGGLDE